MFGSKLQFEFRAMIQWLCKFIFQVNIFRTDSVKIKNSLIQLTFCRRDTSWSSIRVFQQFSGLENRH